MAAANQARPLSITSERINLKTVEEAVRSLVKWRKSRSHSEKLNLSDQEDEFFYLVLSLIKVPHRDRANTYKILLPHSLLSESSELCLIIDDRIKKGLTKDDAQKKIKSENIPISNVLKLSKLKSNYRSSEAKRELCASYNMFFADKSAAPQLPGLLGKKKVPVPLDLKDRNWKEQIEKACSSTLLCLKTGTCCVVKVAKVSMEMGEIVENVIAACNGIADVVPSKWGNIRSFHLKLLVSLSLPIYQADPDKDSN
ncbi:ribosomal L1 domain-containing protein 1-like [Neltuma alba]|uniref:ribosomal L1 domain-containing protein 1-like n=1 Tax=Neltuma alba TaxID=207710 RepID=UPI0010A59FF8|nr:ribosomal L1 domain-containing protein 1-like [Prosopis alba]